VPSENILLQACSPEVDCYTAMSLDELLFECDDRRLGNLWRLYIWEPPAVSIGRNQEVGKAVRVDAIRSHQLDLVRRPTGGRAIWHKGDVCFTCAGWIGGGDRSATQPG